MFSSSSTSARGVRASWRFAAAGVLGASILYFAAGTAQAHVTVRPDSTTTGTFSVLAFRVPNESPTAGTVKLSVQLPQDKPFLFVSTKPVPGWKVDVQQAPLPKPVTAEGTKITKAARTITWTAQGGTQIAPGQYQEFPISVGPLPDPGEVSLPITQTYSDGTVVTWNEPTPASGAEPEHPAPAFQVAAATGDSASPSVSAQPTASAQPSAPVTSSVAKPDTTARWLGGAALLVALGAAAAALAGSRRGARP
jgi:uncharacterized protein YcnI